MGQLNLLMRLCGYIPSLYPRMEGITRGGIITQAPVPGMSAGALIIFCYGDLLPNLKKAFILKDVMGSDHCPIGIEISKL